MILRPGEAPDLGERLPGRWDPPRGPRRALLRWLAQHWLALWLVGAALLAALPVAAPLLAASGHHRSASLLYAAFRPMCHQLPHHSWFLGGRAATYALADVQAALGPTASAALAFHRPLAAPPFGFQMAVCQRDLATYAGLLAASLAYALGASGRALGWRGYAACLVPIAADGLTQLVGLRESTPLLRSATGGLFGAATALFVLPQVDAAFRELQGALPAAGRGWTLRPDGPGGERVADAGRAGERAEAPVVRSAGAAGPNAGRARVPGGDGDLGAARGP